jgi:hypothetical protein
MTTHLNPQQRAEVLRAARGEIRRTASTPMGIRYLTRPAPPAAPAKPRPAWAELLSVAQLVNNDEPAERRRPARPAASRPIAPARRAVSAAATPAPAPVAPAPVAPAPVAPAPVVPAAAAAPRVVSSHPAFCCPACGGRYRADTGDHDCGPLTPVTVTITTKPAPDLVPGVLGSYDVFGCQTCGDRYGQPVDGHRCGPLTPMVITIARRGGEPDA